MTSGHPARLSRRALLGGVMGFALSAAACGPNASQAETDGVALTDLRGRAVRAPENARLAIDDGRFLIALALIHPDPASVLAAWPGDVHRIGPELHAEFAQRFPALDSLPRIASSAENFNMEAVLAAAPDVLVASAGTGPTDAQIAQLERAGIAVAFIDFFNSPFENQGPSLALLGALIGRSGEAARYNDFRDARLAAIAERVAALPDAQRPTVLMEAHAGMSADCCNSPGRGNVGDYIDFAGGHNIGADVLSAPSGRLNLEYVIERDPDIYIATGGPHLAQAGGFVSGPGFDAAQSRASLARMAARRGVSSLKAVREGRVYGLAHQIINSPIDIVVVEALARWIHPDLFADIDPRATLDEINRTFLAAPYRGEYWVALDPARAPGSLP